MKLSPRNQKLLQKAWPGLGDAEARSEVFTLSANTLNRLIGLAVKLGCAVSRTEPRP